MNIIFGTNYYKPLERGMYQCCKFGQSDSLPELSTFTIIVLNILTKKSV